MPIPKITKTTISKLKECKKGQIVKFSPSLSIDEIEDIVASFGFRTYFYEPSTIEYKKNGKHTVRLT
jgi:hypothetical protein